MPRMADHAGEDVVWVWIKCISLQAGAGASIYVDNSQGPVSAAGLVTMNKNG